MNNAKIKLTISLPECLLLVPMRLNLLAVVAVARVLVVVLAVAGLLAVGLTQIFPV
jgi:hypothetical protein